MTALRQWRSGTAAALAGANLVYLTGEPVGETDTGKFKIGDGATAYNSLAYQGVTGAAQTIVYRSIGDGSDGDVVINSGTTTMTRDMYYNSLTMSGSGILITNGFRLFVKTLDLSAAAVGAIQWNGNDGGSASGSTAGTPATAQPGGSLEDIGQGATGNAGGNGVSSAGAVAPTMSGNGGNGGAGGGGGNGVAGSAGNGGGTRVPTNASPLRGFVTNFLFGGIQIGAGAGGSAASAGAGDTFFALPGGGAGSGGNGGGTLAIYAFNIIKSAATPAGVIQANGGQGGSGGNGNPSLGGTGGGGGAGGGGGGWVYIAYVNRAGPVIAGAVQVSGGNGGQGGNGSGTGIGGAGGNAGSGGRVTRFNMTTQAGTDNLFQSLTTIFTDLVGSQIVTGTAGGSGAVAGTSAVSI